MIGEAATSEGHRRLFLTGLLDLPPEAIFNALRERLHPDAIVTVETARGPVNLQGVPLRPGEGSPLLIPYLVGGAGPNTGSAGFAALLRDEVPTGLGPPRILLILDRQPVETVRTAAEDASELRALSWERLVEASVSSAHPSVLPLLLAIVEDDRRNDRLPRTADTIGTLRGLASQTDPALAGAALHVLGSYLADSAAHLDPKRRLRLGATWRTQLDAWSSPDQDLEKRLRPRYENLTDPGLAAVLKARTPFGLDFAGFELDDMPRQRAAASHSQLARPVRTRGAACASIASRAAIWCPGGGTFTIVLAAAAAQASSAKVVWADGAEPTTIDISVGDIEVPIEVEEGDWRFARLELVGGNSADLAIFTGAGDWAPFEASLDLDLGSSAFRSTDEPRLLAMGPGGNLLGQPAVDGGDGSPADGEPRRYATTLNGQSQPIDLLLVAAIGEEEEEQPDTGEPGESTSEEDQDESEDEAGVEGAADEYLDGSPSEPQSASEIVPSVAHAKLADSRTGKDAGDCSFRVAGGVGNILTPGLKELSRQELGSGLDGLQLEQQILASPEVTAFTVDRTSGEPFLERHPYLDRLVLTGMPQEPLEAFLQARVAFFHALQPYGSVHAVGAGTAEVEARAYVRAYDALLDAMLDAGRFVAEFERLVLCDAVYDPNTGDILIAPSNPVTVQYLLALSETITGWLPRASEVLQADLSTCTTRHLLPAFATQGVWYETGDRTPLLWRRYRPQSRANPGDHRPGYIARRIEHFLRVHPEYRDVRQSLSLAFHEPGDGATVLDALRRLVKPLAAGPTARPLPHLDVTIVSSSDEPTALERMLTGSAASRPAEISLDRLLRDRVTVTRAAPYDGLPQWAHISFVFQSSLDREPAAVDLDARAGTLYCGGLAASPGRHTEPGRNETTFHWGTFTGTEPANGLPGLVRKTLEVISGMPRDHMTRGRTRMPSTRVGRTFLGDLYTSSAWVVHLDKLLGLEAFAPDASGKQARYLIDYEDRADPAQPGLDAITATGRVAPYRLALRRALTGLGRPTEAALDRLLQLFNGVSGQWALDLVGANANDLHERIGLAAAIASLQDLDGGFGTDEVVGLVLPLREMLDALPPGARPAGGRLCDDLLLLHLPLKEARPRLRGRLIEVKYRGSTDPGTAEYAREQLSLGHDWLLDTFGPDDGPRRPFRSRDLAELIRGSATRAAAFGLLHLSDRREFERAIDAVARGEFSFSLGFEAGGTPLVGDFISIEADSAVPAHRQMLPGDGYALGHVRLGRPALEALATGRPLPRPTTLPLVTMPQQDARPPAASDPEDPDEGGTPPAPGRPSSPTPDASGGSSDEPRQPRSPQRSPEVELMASRLDAACAKYGLGVEPFSVELAQLGPSVIRFRTRTLGKLSISDVERRSRDIGREIAAPGEVQVGDEPGFVTIDVPRTEREPVPLSQVLPHLDAHNGKPGALSFVAGVAPSGAVCVADLSRLPHLLVAGATGSGKSVFLRGLLIELLRSRTPEQLHLVIIDPKRLDFAAFANAPHLRGGIISDPDVALEQLRFTLEAEIELRQPILEDAGVSSATEYYEAGGRLEDLPQLVILVDEFADLVLAGSDRRAFSEMIQRYAQLTRAYGIFLVLATQRPSVDVVTGSIKANLSARIAFSLPSARDSMTVLDRGGAEDLLGDGDMLFYRNGRIERLQAPFASLADVRSAVT